MGPCCLTSRATGFNRAAILALDLKMCGNDKAHKRVAQCLSMAIDPTLAGH